MDVLFDGEELHVLEAKRVHTQNTHGTGKSLCDEWLQVQTIALPAPANKVLRLIYQGRHPAIV